MTKGGHPEWVSIESRYSFSGEIISTLIKQYFHSSVPHELVVNLLYTLLGDSSELQNILLNDEWVDTPWWSHDIMEHLMWHWTYTWVTLYWVPKIDLWICFIKWKLPKAFEVLFRVIDREIQGFEDVNDTSKVQQMSVLKKRFIEYAQFLSSVDLENWVTKWEMIAKEEREFTTWIWVDEQYGFFTYLAPFYREEDWKKIGPAYKRRLDFLEYIKGVKTSPYNKTSGTIGRIRNWLWEFLN